MAKNPLFGILWIALLFFLGWPFALVVSFPWILLQPLEAIFPNPFKNFNQFLERLVTWPRDLGYAIVNCQSNCPAP